MTDRVQFEAMLEALINEDQETAKEIFHNIVVAKSREIYEELLSEDFSVNEESDDEDDEDKKKEKDEKEVDEGFPGAEEEGEEEEEEEEEEEDSEADDDVGGDATDDLIGDVSDEEDEEGSMSDEEQSDRIMDLEDALEELKAEFEQLMADEGEEGSEEPADMGGEMDDMAGGMDAEMPAEPEQDELAKFMEYVDKVALPKHGDNGANTKSIVAGKNDMGGSVANIARGGESTKGGTQGGLLNPSTKEENFGNINVPGGNAGKTAFKKKEPGHGAEKKGSGDTAPDKKSLIGSR